MRIRISEENKGQKRTEASVKHSRTDCGNGLRSPLISGTCFRHERMGNMSSVIDAQPDSQYQVNARYSINRETPKMHGPVHANLNRENKF